LTAALFDSDVAIAILAEAHEHHAASLALITEGDAAAFAISADGYAAVTRDTCAHCSRVS
jgi:hypothetical protein